MGSVRNRADFGLARHTEGTRRDKGYWDEQNKKKFMPFIVETSAGCDRTLLTCLVDAYCEEEVKGDTRVSLKLHPRVAPFKAAILPLVKKQGMPEVARKLYDDLRKNFKVFYDEGGAVGRRYRRMDEIGTPFCFTVDGQTLEDDTVTMRDRDSMEQSRHKIAEIPDLLAKSINGE